MPGLTSDEGDERGRLVFQAARHQTLVRFAGKVGLAPSLTSAVRVSLADLTIAFSNLTRSPARIGTLADFAHRGGRADSSQDYSESVIPHCGD